MKWERVEFNDVLEKIIGGGTPSKTVLDYWNGDIPWCSVKDMAGDKYQLYSTEDTISHAGLASSSSNLIPTGTVITSTRMGLGRVFINKVDMAINQDLKALIPNNKIDNTFLLWTIVNKKEEIEGLGVGSTVKGIRLEVLKGLKLYLPPLPTQRKIASILSAYDDLIENNLKRIKLLEEKAFVTYKGIVSSEKDLKRLTLAQLATVTSSKRIFFSDYVEEGIPFYRSKEIIAKSNFESIQNPLYITEERYADIKEKFGVPISGDLLVTSVGTIGFIHLVNDDDGDFYFKDGNLIWIRNLINKNLAYFLFFKFRTSEFREMLNSVAIGSSQKALTIETVKKIEVEVPTDESLTEFNKETKTIIKLIYTLQKQNTKLREARDILLPRLMNGQIEV